MSYQIVFHKNKHNLAVIVHNLINTGWKPQGGLSSNVLDGVIEYTQAMVKKDEVYRVLGGDDLETFGESVQKSLDEGWKLQGGIATAGTWDALIYTQAMVKEAEKE